MNAYFFNVTNEDKQNILDQHKKVYDGYVTEYIKPNTEPLYVQDFANDKDGITVSNKGEVMTYRNMNINEMKHDGKDTGLFSDEVEMDEQLDIIGDGPMDLEHGTVEDEDEWDWEGDPYDYMENGGFMGDEDVFDELDLDDDEEKDFIVLSINESLGMFKRFKKYN